MRIRFLVYCLIFTACMVVLVSADPAMAFVPLVLALVLSSHIRPESRELISKAQSFRRRRKRDLRIRRFGTALFVIGLSSGLAVLAPSEKFTDAMRDVLTAISFTAFVFSVVFLFGTSRSPAYGVDALGVVPSTPPPHALCDEQPGAPSIEIPFEAIPFEGGFGGGGDCG